MSLHSQSVKLAKIGHVPMAVSRPLPSENLELLNTIEQLNFKITQLEKYYFELLTVYNELLAKLNKPTSSQSKKEQDI
ncbi:MAG: hypothetical protein AB4206_09205 [Xenococcaceae cyanobacterium]